MGASPLVTNNDTKTSLPCAWLMTILRGQFSRPSDPMYDRVLPVVLNDSAKPTRTLDWYCTGRPLQAPLVHFELRAFTENCHVRGAPATFYLLCKIESNKLLRLVDRAIAKAYQS